MKDLYQEHKGTSDVVDTYNYTDETGKLLFQVQRHLGKRFTQRRPDGDAWIYSLGDVRRVIYRLQAVRAAIAEQQRVYIVEGEKDVHTLEGIGLTATCSPGGAGKWRGEYSEIFKDADVVIIPDNDVPGREHADAVALALGMFAKTIRVIRLPDQEDHGDVTDWLMKKGDKDKLELIVGSTNPDERIRPKFWTAPELMAEKFQDQRFAVPGLITEGFTLLVGAPKVGKSWLALNLAVAVASGSDAMGSIPVEQGKVLYIALEDTPRRLKNRLYQMLGTMIPAPQDLVCVTNWPRLTNGGIDQLIRYLTENKDTRMVIIDTWGKIRSHSEIDNGLYNNDYEAVTGIKNVADEFGVSIVAVHHQRKASDNDPLVTVLGSQGLTGAADAVAILTRQRGQNTGTIYVTGRDIMEGKAAVEFQADTGTWLWLGDADEAEEKNNENQVIAYLSQLSEPASPKDVSAALEIPDGTSKWLLAKLAQEGKIGKEGRGRYVSLDAKVIDTPLAIPSFDDLDFGSLDELDP